MRHFKRLKKRFIDDLSEYITRHKEAAQEDCAPFLERAVESSAKVGSAKSFARVSASAPLCDTAAITLPEKQPTFQQNLFRLIDEKGVRDSAVYKRADIDRRLFSKIRADVDYHPSKSTAVKLCLALELGIKDAERLLETAGYCLSLSDTADLVLRYCIEHKTFRLIEVNEALDYFGQDVL